MTEMTNKNAVAPAKNLLHLLRQGDIYPEYQPVIDKQFKIKGAEIILRNSNGNLLKPQHYFPAVSGPLQGWKMMTELLLEDAVNKINSGGKNIDFSMYVPACLAESHLLVSIVLFAVLRLKDVRHADRLVLEIDINTDFIRCPQSFINVKELREMGIQIYLGNCFSPGSRNLPQKAVICSGYKIDMRAVWQAAHDTVMKQEIARLASHCRRHGLECVAEGIESIPDVSLMASLGIVRYQGCLISPPVSWRSLKRMETLSISDNALISQ